MQALPHPHMPPSSPHTHTHTRTHAHSHTSRRDPLATPELASAIHTMRCVQQQHHQHHQQQLAAHRHIRLSRPAVGRRRVHAVAAAAASGDAVCAAPTHGGPAASGPPVLVVPAFYLDAQTFRPLVEELRARGYNAALPPVRWTDWVPTLGGRSVRPILDRMDWALTQLLEGHQVSEANNFEIPLPRRATAQDWLTEIRDASKGAQPALELTGPWRGSQRAAIVGSSAAGWISRIFLGRGPVAYSGAVYHGADRVHTLVTLGTPHTSAEPVTRRNIDFVNEHYACLDDVRYVALASRTVEGSARGFDFPSQSYQICAGRGDVWGDGVTPVECALALEGAQHITLEGAKHVPLGRAKQGEHWYGSGPFLETWVDFLHHPGASDAAGGGASGQSAASSSSGSSGSSSGA